MTVLNAMRRILRQRSKGKDWDIEKIRNHEIAEGSKDLHSLHRPCLGNMDPSYDDSFWSEGKRGQP